MPLPKLEAMLRWCGGEQPLLADSLVAIPELVVGGRVKIRNEAIS